MSRTNRELKDLVFEHLLEISAGTCSITEDKIHAEPDPDIREIMTGFLFLHDELELRQRNSEEAQAKMRQAMEQAEASNQAKSRFLANVSHELRTPMNGVLGVAELILQTGLQGEQLRYAKAIQSSARSLLVVIDDVLDMAKIESGRLEVSREPFDLLHTLTELIERYTALARGKGTWLRVRYGPDVPRYLVGDAGRLGQILTNYLGNAIKFTEQGEVILEVECTSIREGSAQLRLAVSDTGIGIPSSKLDLLFQPFSQLDSSMTREFSGTGLGLAISKQLALLLGGEVGVQSQPGEGSTFWLEISLPVDEAHPQERIPPGTHGWSPQQRPSASAETDEEESSEDEFEVLESSEDGDEDSTQSTTAGGAASSDQVRVLVVEDNAVNRLVATRMLQTLGCRVDTAADGVEGLRRARTLRYDIIFMDCQMPRMDGFAATAAIREQVPGGKDVPIVAMTAHAMTGDRERCLEAGMNDYITKPISVGALAAVLPYPG